MNSNMGTLDRMIRVFVGLGLILAFFLNPAGTFSWLYMIGLVPLVTALIGTCPLYRMLGISTCGKS